MKYAIVQIQGKQYKVGQGDILAVEKINVETGQTVSFDKVLLVVLGQRVLIGRPEVEGVKVKGLVLEQFCGPKIRVAKYKAKSRYRKVRGQRRKLSRIKITEIKLSGRRKTKDS